MSITPFMTMPASPARPVSPLPAAGNRVNSQVLAPTQQDGFFRTNGQLQQVASSPVQTALPFKPISAINNTQLTPIWHNDLKAMFHRNEAVVYALNIRTFGAKDKNGDGRISSRLNEGGTFLSAIENLDELKALGVNTIHLLPINPIGKSKRFGEAGSLYAPSDYHRLNEEFADPSSNLSVVQQARLFVQECHKRGIHVMVDVPSCASHDLMKARPDLIARDTDGTPLTPTNWVDVVMFKNGPALQEYYEGFFDLMANQLGVDGFRADIARARTPEFWRHFIGKYPDKAWLAETYCEEDQSPLPNLPRDIPETLMKTGFDSMYGQFHIFHSMANAEEYINYLLENRAMFMRASQTGGNDKSFIGSFLTHDDPSLMEKGGVPICLLVSGLMATQPWTNPYILDGFTTGYKGDFDIFNYVPRHVGQNPEIGRFLQQMLKLRRDYAPVLTQGVFIPIPVKGEANNQIIAFARQANGRTLLVIANKDINARHDATLQIPGLSPAQPLVNLAPEYGQPSEFTPQLGELKVNLGPARFFVFEINTPNLALNLPAY
jgi:hypothetical protein